MDNCIHPDFGAVRQLDRGTGVVRLVDGSEEQSFCHGAMEHRADDDGPTPHLSGLSRGGRDERKCGVREIARRDAVDKPGERQKQCDTCFGSNFGLNERAKPA